MAGPYHGGAQGTRMCIGCGRQISVDFKVCPYCSKPAAAAVGGSPGESKMCVGCGMQVQANWTYCPYCGKKHG